MNGAAARAEKAANTRLVLMNCLLLVIGLFGTLRVFLGQFAYPHIAVIIIVSLALAAAFYALYSFAQGRTLLITMLGLLAVWLLGGWLLWDVLSAGAQTAFGYIIPYLYKIMSYDFGIRPVPDGYGEMACAAYIIYIMMPYVAALVRAVAFRKSSLLSVLLTAVPTAIALMLCPLPPSYVLVMLLAFWITLLFRSRMFRHSTRSELTVSLLTLCASTAVLSTLFIAFPRDTYEESASAFAIRDDIIDMAVSIEDYGLFDNFRTYVSGAPLTASDGSVNLNSMGRLRFSDKDIMRVYTKTPRTIYLRGYSASVYDGNKWSQGEDDALQAAGIDYQPMMYLEREEADIAQDFSGLQFETTVEMLGSKSNFVFTPYYLADVKADGEQMEWVSDSYLEPTGQKKFTYSSFFTPYKNVITSLSSLIEHRDIYMPTEAGDYRAYAFNEALTSNGDVSVTINNGEQAGAYDDTIKSTADFIEAYYPDEAFDKEYMLYIAEEYTKLPDGLAEQLVDWSIERANEPIGRDYSTLYYSQIKDAGYTSYMDWAWIAADVADQVRASGSYTTSPGFQPVNRDFVEYFLNERNQGYCVHFASSTVAVLRALGIPARYAEGYVVGESLFSSNGWATVPAKNAHTWAEIWLPGIGWTPVESTPGGTAVSYINEAEDEQPTPLPAATPTPEATAAATPTPAQSATPKPSPTATDNAATAAATTNGNNGNGGNPLLIAVVIIALLIAAVLLARAVRKQLRERRFGDSDANRAAAYIYTYLERLGGYGLKVSDKAADIAAKARFSQHTVDPAELGSLKAEFYNGRRRLSAESGGRVKILLWLQYI